MASVVRSESYQVVVQGGGLAGLTTAINLREKGYTVGVIMGDGKEAQLPINRFTPNFPGFPDGISGKEILSRMTEQAKKFGASLIEGHVARVDFTQEPFQFFSVTGQTFLCDAAAVATGTFQVPLGLESEDRLKGVFKTAITDPLLCKGKHITIMGGGNTAMFAARDAAEDGAESITIVCQKAIHASKAHHEAALQKGCVILECVDVVKLCGEDSVTGIMLKNQKTQETTFHPTDALIVTNGRKPNTEMFRGQLDLNPDGTIKVVSGKTGTSRKGVFGAGDCITEEEYRRMPEATAGGSRVAVEIDKYFKSKKEPTERKS